MEHERSNYSDDSLYIWALIIGGFIFFAWVVVVMCARMGSSIETAKGEKLGTIVGISKEGIFSKTNEIDFVSDGGKASKFTVKSDFVLGEINAATELKEHVRLTYRCTLDHLSSETGCYVQDIVPI